jgi:oligosaccharyltransferase complex subunit epsilon
LISLFQVKKIQSTKVTIEKMQKPKIVEKTITGKKVKGDIDDSSLSVENLVSIFGTFKEAYSRDTPKRIKLIDLFCLFCFLIGVFQLGYVALVGSFPKNAFMSGLTASWHL